MNYNESDVHMNGMMGAPATTGSMMMMMMPSPMMTKSEVFTGGTSSTAGGSRSKQVKSLSKQASVLGVSEQQLQQHSQHGGHFENNSKGKALAKPSVKRSFSAVKNAPPVLKKQLSVKDESMQLMILKVKQQCTKKQFNDPNEIKKLKDRMKESTKINTLVGSASSGGAVSAAAIRIRSMKESANPFNHASVGGNEEDDDEDSDCAS